MFCRECGKMLQEGTRFCTGCGTKILPITNNQSSNESSNNVNNVYNNVSSTNSINYSNMENNNDKNSIGLNILSFFIPIVGLILFLVWKNEYPKKSKNIGICALIGYILSFLASFVWALWLMTSYIPSHIDDDYDYDYHYHYDYDDNYYKFNNYYRNDRHDI